MSKSVVERVVDWANSQGGEQKSRSRPWRWVVGLGIGAVVLFFIAFLTWRAFRQGRELAKLKHERDVGEQNKIRAEKEMLLEANERDISKYNAKVWELRGEIKRIDDGIEAVEEENRRAKESIDALQTWDDVDKWLAGDGPGKPDPPGAA